MFCLIKQNFFENIPNLFLFVRFEFAVSPTEVPKRTLDVAVKNSGGFLSRDKGLLGKASFIM